MKVTPGHKFTKGKLIATAVSLLDVIPSNVDSLSKNYIKKILFNANTILAADTDNAPTAVTLGEQTVLGRITSGNITGLTATQLMALILTTGDYIEIHLTMDYSTIRALGKPTDVHRGLFNGFSLPIYASDNEEIFLSVHVPHDWDEASDFTVKVYGYIDTANDAKNFKLRLHWENVTSGTDAFPATDNDVDVQTATGASAAQYQSYEVTFTIDYDIDGGGNEIARGDNMGLLLQRIAASANEITGEFVVTDAEFRYKRNLMGES